MRFMASATTAAAFTLAIALVSTPTFANSVHLTGNLQADYMKGPTAQQIIDTFTSPDQPPFAGVGWEVIIGKVGFGGEYDADFTRTPQGTWWLDWITQPLFLSYHFFRTSYFFDPFIQAGVGCAGGVYPQQWPESEISSDLLISIYPLLALASLSISAAFSFRLRCLMRRLGRRRLHHPLRPTPWGVQMTVSDGIAIDW